MWDCAGQRRQPGGMGGVQGAPRKRAQWRDSLHRSRQAVGVAFGCCGVVCRAVLVGRDEDCSGGLRFFNERFFTMSRDAMSQPGELVHRSGSTAIWSYTDGMLRAGSRPRGLAPTSPFPPVLSSSSNGGQP
ncbi:hypothetical protein CKY51_11880 [Xanthomonas maliensis]|nr:hypothetical protein CKY51_11880 [Xanthomonas maliensis]